MGELLHAVGEALAAEFGARLKIPGPVAVGFFESRLFEQPLVVVDQPDGGDVAGQNVETLLIPEDIDDGRIVVTQSKAGSGFDERIQRPERPPLGEHLHVLRVEDRDIRGGVARHLREQPLEVVAIVNVLELDLDVRVGPLEVLGDLAEHAQRFVSFPYHETEFNGLGKGDARGQGKPEGYPEESQERAHRNLLRY